MGEKLKTQFYQQQLRLAPDPTELEFEIEEVLGEKKVRGEPYIHVKYLYYPCK